MFSAYVTSNVPSDMRRKVRPSNVFRAIQYRRSRRMLLIPYLVTCDVTYDLVTSSVTYDVTYVPVTSSVTFDVKYVPATSSGLLNRDVLGVRYL